MKRNTGSNDGYEQALCGNEVIWTNEDCNFSYQVYVQSWHQTTIVHPYVTQLLMNKQIK